MAEKLEDLSLPNSVVVRILKDSIPDSVNVSKEARTAFAKSASVFVLYATSCANSIALKANRKTLTANDVLQAMSEMEFDDFIEPLQKSLEAHHAEKGKKDSTMPVKAKRKKSGIELSKDTATANGISYDIETNGISMDTDGILMETDVLHDTDDVLQDSDALQNLNSVLQDSNGVLQDSNDVLQVSETLQHSSEVLQDSNDALQNSDALQNLDALQHSNDVLQYPNALQNSNGVLQDSDAMQHTNGVLHDSNDVLQD